MIARGVMIDVESGGAQRDVDRSQPVDGDDLI